MTLSAYERQRLENIATNERKLQTLGLLSAKEEMGLRALPSGARRRSHPRRDDDCEGNVVLRKSPRVANLPPSHGALDEFDDDEEDDRLLRKKQKKDSKILDLNEDKLKVQVMSFRGEDISLVNMNFDSALNDSSTVIGNNGVPMYHTDGQKGRCDRCGGFFVLSRKWGTLHKHSCTPGVHAMLPSMS
jgi:hypothetical protein